MKKIDHVRKTVYIIVGCLTIVSLVLSICHKVGHCASSTTFLPISNFPLYYGLYDNILLGTGGFTLEDDSVLDDILIDYQSNIAAVGADAICFVENNTSSLQVICFTFSTESFFTSGSFPDVSISMNVRYSCYYNIYSNGTFSRSSYNLSTRQVNMGELRYINYPLISGNSAPYSFLLSGRCLYYPLYIRDAVNKSSLSTPLFTNYEGSIPPFPGGHTKGGVLGSYIDSSQLLEDDSELPSVDITPPSDSSSNPAWFQKILNGLGKINDSIKGGVLTIGDYIGQGFENVLNWLTEPFDQEAFSDELDQVFLLSDILGAKDLLAQSGFFDWEDITPSQNVSWTFDFGGAVLPHTSCTIDFSWYTGTVKNLIVTLICTFLVVGLLATLFNSIPSIISGHSGDKGGGSDS